jgi:hypothetical protein
MRIARISQLVESNETINSTKNKAKPDSSDVNKDFNAKAWTIKTKANAKA